MLLSRNMTVLDNRPKWTRNLLALSIFSGPIQVSVAFNGSTATEGYTNGSSHDIDVLFSQTPESVLTAESHPVETHSWQICYSQQIKVTG